ncbi:MAG: hypothetical protein GFH27_549303n278 [Chloroflexi bacterium AL-W]|nr:hypothetical protein [Chloroflexi bacterium AL-N1]NOK68163.1 hypothetical protein [Chloroflexi bacterium AL-N10]NOK73503.1 hypothetical protein [Chloroflexi bacterium AL-N5]NOK83417.1 hypothetical protein [Chloroflexi bacterium AL-W]NOK87834.1 hypothetical protein [Chloroflexi bacterium AL-N15]
MNDKVSFGLWVKQRRKELGLTQQELAQQVGCALTTVQKIESDTRRPSRQMTDRLAACLHIPSTEHTTFLTCARSCLPTSVSSITASKERVSIPNIIGLLPVLANSIIGREDDIATITSLLMDTDVRLITLIGPPGVGKTSLAIKVATDLQSTFADNIIFVSLVTSSDMQSFTHTLATALNIQIMSSQSVLDTLIVALRQQHTLLVLDNFEQLLDVAPLLTSLLTQTLHLKILVTSRARLGLLSERVFVVPSLKLPSSDEDISHMVQTPASALQLFVTRAQAVNPHFTLNYQNVRTIATLCHRLDGLPLALELVAAWSYTLSPQMMLRSLDAQLLSHHISPNYVWTHQQTLQAAFDWSYQLLDTPTQDLLARLSIFAEDWSLEAAQAICGYTDSAENDAPNNINSKDIDTSFLNQIHTLVSHSWIEPIVTATGVMRYRLLTTVRLYVSDYLRYCQTWPHYHKRQAQYYVNFIEQVNVQGGQPARKTTLSTITQEYSNIRAALEWSSVHDLSLLSNLCAALWYYWYVQGYIVEGRHWIETALQSSYQATDDITYAHIQKAAGVFAYSQGDHDQAIHYSHAALTLYQRFEDTRGIATILNTLGGIARLQGNDIQAIDYFEQSKHLLHQLNDQWAVAQCLFNIGNVLYDNTEFLRSQDIFEQSATIFLQLHNQREYAAAMINLGCVRSQLKDYGRAHQILNQSIHLWREFGDQRGLASAVEELGHVELNMNNQRQACACFQECLQIRQKQNDKLGIIWLVEAGATLSVSYQNYQKAQKLFATAIVLREHIQVPRSKAEQYRLEPSIHVLSQHGFDDYTYSLKVAPPMEHVIAELFQIFTIL